MITRNFTIQLLPTVKSDLKVVCSQYDSEEKWVFTVLNGSEQVIPTSASIVGKKPDGNAIINEAVVDESGRIIVTETEQMTARSGYSHYELRLNDDTHGTANFSVWVEKTPIDSAVMSESDLSLIQETLDAINKITTENRGVASITQTVDDGVNTITVNLTDGTSESFTIKDGTNGTDGKDGTNGKDGVGISSIDTTSSSESGGTNTVTITMTDDTSKSFSILNGVDGKDGKDGKDGTNITKTSELTNDSGFIAISDVEAKDYVTNTALTEKDYVSSTELDAKGYQTASQVQTAIESATSSIKTDWNSISDKPFSTVGTGLTVSSETLKVDDDYVNTLIDTKLGVIENGNY